jgi:hypothetical protein
MVDKKVIYVAYANEDKKRREELDEIRLETTRPYRFVDLPDGDIHDEKWKERVRKNVTKSDGVIALISKHTLSSGGQRWEIECACDEEKKIIGLWAYDDDTTRPAVIERYRTVHWTKEDISRFIDSL